MEHKNRATAEWSGADRFQALHRVVAEWRDSPGALLPVLEQAQKLYGFLSADVLSAVADGLGIPLAEVAETAGFYSLLKLEKTGEHVIHICDSSACHMDGSRELRRTLQRVLGIPMGGTTPDGKFTLLSCGCLGACGRAPAVMLDGHIYGPVTAEYVTQLLSALDCEVAE